MAKEPRRFKNGENEIMNSRQPLRVNDPKRWQKTDSTKSLEAALIDSQTNIS